MAAFWQLSFELGPLDPEAAEAGLLRLRGDIRDVCRLAR